MTVCTDITPAAVARTTRGAPPGVTLGLTTAEGTPTGFSSGADPPNTFDNTNTENESTPTKKVTTTATPYPTHTLPDAFTRRSSQPPIPNPTRHTCPLRFADELPHSPTGVASTRPGPHMVLQSVGAGESSCCSGGGAGRRVGYPSTRMCWSPHLAKRSERPTRMCWPAPWRSEASDPASATDRGHPPQPQTRGCGWRSPRRAASEASRRYAEGDPLRAFRGHRSPSPEGE